MNESISFDFLKKNYQRLLRYLASVRIFDGSVSRTWSRLPQCCINNSVRIYTMSCRIIAQNIPRTVYPDGKYITEVKFAKRETPRIAANRDPRRVNHISQLCPSHRIFILHIVKWGCRTNELVNIWDSIRVWDSVRVQSHELGHRLSRESYYGS